MERGTRTATPVAPFSPNYMAGIGAGAGAGVCWRGLVVSAGVRGDTGGDGVCVERGVTWKDDDHREVVEGNDGGGGIGTWGLDVAGGQPDVDTWDCRDCGAVLLATKIPGLKILGGVIVFLGIAGGVPVGMIFWLRNSLGVQAAVIEGLTVRASMARSKVLTEGAKGRAFVLLLLAGALAYAASLLQMPLMVFVMFTVARGGKAVGSEIVMLLVDFWAIRWCSRC